MKRESFRSRLGFLLVSAGCAIGIGNVWKFPYVTGEYGGGVFVLFYLLFLVIMGVPVLTMELAVGRASRKSAVQGYRALEPAGSKWHIHGWFCMIGCYLLMMYYTTVSGWMLGYFFKFAGGAFEGIALEAVDGVFYGLRAASVALITAALLQVAKVALLRPAQGLESAFPYYPDWIAILLAAAIFILAKFTPLKKLHPICFIALAAAAGIVFQM